jgi:hypothetical protein
MIYGVAFNCGVGEDVHTVLLDTPLS